jgi:Gas vesicle synthesis protein GvpL/GvpF
MGDAGTYIYAVGRELSADRMTSVRGLGGSELRLVEQDGLVAVVSTVDLDEFGESGLRRNLEDLSWLEEVARGHDEVVRSAADAAPTIAPLRLATICHTDEGVRRRLDEWHHDLVQALDRIEGRNEWSVKAYTTPPTPVDDRDTSEAESAGPGTAYLKRRRAKLAQDEQAAVDSALVADEMHSELAAGSVASRRLAPQDPRLSGHRGTMALNGAYLVDTARTDGFHALVRDLAERHPEIRLQIDGPWPPYSFATLDDTP